MSSYTHFTLEERKYLQELLAQGYSMRKIASFLGRAPSSVSREIKRNRSKYPPKKKSSNPYNYHHWRAQICAITRRRQKRQPAIPENSSVRQYVMEGRKKTRAKSWLFQRYTAIYNGMNFPGSGGRHICADAEKTRTTFIATVM